MTKKQTLLVLECNSAVRFALSRISLGSAVEMEFVSPSDWYAASGDYFAILGDDSLLEGQSVELPIERLTQKYKCPLIIMTTNGQTRFHAFIKNHGAAAVLLKPFSVGDLRRELGKVVGDYELESNAIDFNGREKNMRSFELGGRIASEQVFDELFIELEKRQPLDKGIDAFDVVERQLVKRALQSCSGNQSQASRFLGITRNTLRKRIKKYGFTSYLTGEDNSE